MARTKQTDTDSMDEQGDILTVFVYDQFSTEEQRDFEMYEFHACTDACPEGHHVARLSDLKRAVESRTGASVNLQEYYLYLVDNDVEDSIFFDNKLSDTEILDDDMTVVLVLIDGTTSATAVDLTCC
jgi:hypothetical protein